jgi:hypothetical protein
MEARLRFERGPNGRSELVGICFEDDQWISRPTDVHCPIPQCGEKLEVVSRDVFSTPSAKQGG